MKRLTIFFAFAALFVLGCGEGAFNLDSLSGLLEAMDSSSSSYGKSSSSHQSSGNQSNGTTGTVVHCGQTYKTVVIGNQTWMAENMNCPTSIGGSKCYNDSESNCQKYGRLYNWEAAMQLPSSCNDGSCADKINITKHQGICPAGWHLPRDLEWKALIDFVGGIEVAGKYLKSKTGWDGDDKYGFNALPSGYWLENGSSIGAGSSCYWWSANDKSSNGNTYWLDLVSADDAAGWRPYPGSMPYWDSVRCIKDSN